MGGTRSETVSSLVLEEDKNTKLIQILPEKDMKYVYRIKSFYVLITPPNLIFEFL